MEQKKWRLANGISVLMAGVSGGKEKNHLFN
jgi:hypothetical protein